MCVLIVLKPMTELFKEVYKFLLNFSTLLSKLVPCVQSLLSPVVLCATSHKLPSSLLSHKKFLPWDLMGFGASLLLAYLTVLSIWSVLSKYIWMGTWMVAGNMQGKKRWEGGKGPDWGPVAMATDSSLRVCNEFCEQASCTSVTAY